MIKNNSRVIYIYIFVILSSLIVSIYKNGIHIVICNNDDNVDINITKNNKDEEIIIIK